MLPRNYVNKYKNLKPDSDTFWQKGRFILLKNEYFESDFRKNHGFGTVVVKSLRI